MPTTAAPATRAVHKSAVKRVEIKRSKPVSPAKSGAPEFGKHLDP
jgi:hypothetical protein